MKGARQLVLGQPALEAGDSDYHLVAGERRIESCRRLGRTVIPAVFVAGLRDALTALKAHRDENTCRKELTASELVAFGRRIEALERAHAHARRAATQLAGRDASGMPIFGGAQVGTTEDRGTTRDAVASALGVSHTTYERAKTVVNAAEDPSHPAHQVAVEMQAAMDQGTVTINRAAETVRDEQRRRAHAQIVGGADKSRDAVEAREATVRDLAGKGWLAANIGAELGITEETVKAMARRIGVELPADRQLRGYRKTIDPNRVVEQAALGIEGELTTALSLMDGRYRQLEAARLPELIASLRKSRRLLNQFLNNLRGAR